MLAALPLKAYNAGDCIEIAQPLIPAVICNGLSPSSTRSARSLTDRSVNAPAESVFAAIKGDRMDAAKKMLAFVTENSHPSELIDAARLLIFLKGTNAHDYKFSSAVLEDYLRVSAPWRGRFLAASVFNLRGSGERDNDLVERTRAALNS